MAVRRKKIRELVEGILKDAKITQAPVPVWEIAKAKGARIVPNSIDGDLAGFIYRNGDETIIGVNTGQAQVRQNFTVAHELGHFLLHDNDGQLHVDHSFRAVRLRGAVAELGIDENEKEANLFAAELLMPKEFLEKDIEELVESGLDLYDEEMAPKLAAHYGVSTQALMYRLQYLGYFQSEMG